MTSTDWDSHWLRLLLNDVYWLRPLLNKMSTDWDSDLLRLLLFEKATDCDYHWLRLLLKVVHWCRLIIDWYFYQLRRSLILTLTNCGLCFTSVHTPLKYDTTVYTPGTRVTYIKISWIYLVSHVCHRKHKKTLKVTVICLSVPHIFRLEV